MKMLYDIIAGIISMIAKSLEFHMPQPMWHGAYTYRDWCVSYPASCFSSP